MRSDDRGELDPALDRLEREEPDRRSRGSRAEARPDLAPAGAPDVKRVVVIRNGRAGEGREAGELLGALRAAGIDAEIREVAGSDLSDTAAAAAREADAVVAAGGDGTVSAVAHALAGTGTPMGVLPVGTLNHFARDLGLPLELDAAARVIAAGAIRQVDVGEVNGRRFVNNSSVGFYPRVVRRRTRLRALLGKWLAMAWGALGVLWRFPRLRLHLRTEDGAAPVVTPFLFVGNNRYAPGLLRERRREALDRGALHVFVAHGAGRWDLVRVGLRFLLGRGRDSDLSELSARTVQVESRRAAIDVAADGEVFRLRPPLRYLIRPGALAVLAPPEPS